MASLSRCGLVRLTGADQGLDQGTRSQKIWCLSGLPSSSLILSGSLSGPRTLDNVGVPARPRRSQRSRPVC